MQNDTAVAASPRTGGRFEALDALRGVAATSVVLFHVQWVSVFDMISLVKNAWLFVDLFFVLSGFVIAYTYVDKLRARSDLMPFIAKRLARIYPLHFVMLFAFLALECAKGLAFQYANVRGDLVPFSINNADTFIKNLLLIHSLHTYDVLTWNVPSWSISVEFAVYLVFAIVAVVARGSPRALTVLSAVMVALAFAALLWFAPGQGLHVDVDFGFLRCVFGFFLGVLTYLAWRGAQGRISVSSGLADSIQIACLILCFATIALFGEKPAWQFTVPVASALCILSLSLWANTATTRVLTVAPLRRLGQLSFALYMGHYFVLVVVNNLLRVVHLNRFGPVAEMVIGTALAVLCVAAAIQLASMLNRYVEDPCVKAGARWLRRGEIRRLSAMKEPVQ
jgi:peptidoglycan/LPS O-acetylase OafA/YrhL